MTSKPVKFYPAKILSTKCDYVGDFDETLTQLVEDLKDTAKHHSAEGLAAPQIGSSIRVFVIREGEDYKSFVNPRILETSVTQVQADEGCLSFPQVFGTVPRAEWVKVSYQIMDGSLVEEVLADSLSVAFQHELDHLNGVVFISHMGQISKHLALKRHTKVQKRIDNNIKRVQAQLDKLGKGNVVSP